MLKENQVAWSGRGKQNWLLSVFKKNGFQCLESKTKLNRLSCAFTPPLSSSSSSSVGKPPPLWKVGHSCFAYFLLVLKLQMNITERWSSFMNRKAGKWRDLYLCGCDCVRRCLVRPQRERSHLHKWKRSSYWREKENLHFFQLNACGIITTEKSMYYVSGFE